MSESEICKEVQRPLQQTDSITDIVGERLKVFVDSAGLSQDPDLLLQLSTKAIDAIKNHVKQTARAVSSALAKHVDTTNREARVSLGDNQASSRERTLEQERDKVTRATGAAEVLTESNKKALADL